jgi:hypothetical protein
VGVFINGAMADPVWRVLSEDLRRRMRDGGQVRPEYAEVIETLRLAAASYLAGVNVRPGGPISGGLADIEPGLQRDHRTAAAELSTDELAARLHVTERHARRLAAEHGIEPVGRNRWAALDVAALVESRKPAA